MKNSKQKAVEQLREIRDSGQYNMFMDRREIMQYANENDMCALVSFVGNDVYEKYPELLEEL